MVLRADASAPRYGYTGTSARSVPVSQKFSVVSAEGDYTAQAAWEAVWDRGAADGDVFS